MNRKLPGQKPGRRAVQMEAGDLFDAAEQAPQLRQYVRCHRNCGFFGLSLADYSLAPRTKRLQLRGGHFASACVSLGMGMPVLDFTVDVSRQSVEFGARVAGAN